MSVIANAPIPDYDVRTLFYDRYYELGDILALVLIVSICVDDDICTLVQSALEPRPERGGKTLIRAVPLDMMDSEPCRDLARRVPAPIVDDK